MLLLLVLAVAAPTACVLWFMTRAVENERLAVQQRLRDAYGSMFAAARDAIEAAWAERVNRLAPSNGTASDHPSMETFARLVRGGVADAIVFFDADGRPVYPTDGPDASEDRPGEQPAWPTASEPELERRDPAAAAKAYATLAAMATNDETAARALQAQARCLIRIGQRMEAVRVLADTLAADQYRHATDDWGRLIAPDALLFALELLSESGGPEFEAVAEALWERLDDYTGPPMPAAQRRFLMRQYLSLVPDAVPFATLEAERLAAAYVEANASRATGGRLTRTPLPGVWQMRVDDGRRVALFRQQRIVAEAAELITNQISLPDVRATLVPPDASHAISTAFLSLPVGDPLSDWRLVLDLTGSDPFVAAAERQIATYRWMGVLTAAIIATAALLVAGYVGRQARLTRLKNDLIATVSHELKTPLAAIRLLVDTLMRQDRPNETQVNEYLELISMENERLTHLVDNFLTFSRMERNKQVFVFNPVRPAEIVQAAVDTVRERFATAGCRFDVEVRPDLPAIEADRDALVTVLINLLDNAYKYTTGSRHIVLRALPRDGRVCFEVEDNGAGLTRRAARRVFDRFYQVDQSLSRRAGGCGLGLSIVKFIVDAHGGRIGVNSRPGHGSTFTVSFTPSTVDAANPR